jgi:hypothetical protein
MKGKLTMHLSPRCTATSKRTGKPCQAAAVTGWGVCRFHGAGGGGPKGERNGAYRHGERTAEAVAMRREIAGLTRLTRETMAALPPDMPCRIKPGRPKTDPT